ncbi:hypothetical protein J2Z23_004159 [Lederbergia galactosidilyticus]|nr:hypothetical protein [Lederbergia galactosidilytica]
MSLITVCDECGNNLMGTEESFGYHRQSYLTLVNHKCVSPFPSNETDQADQHFCHVGCLKKYYSKITFSIGSGNSQVYTTKTTGGGTIAKSLSHSHE